MRWRLCALVPAVVLGGCGRDEAPIGPEPTGEPTVVSVASPVPAEEAIEEAGAVTLNAAVPVELYFYGVSALHQSFFSNADAVGDLGAALGACLSETAQVAVSWNEEERIGRIFLRVPPEALSACLPQDGAGGVDLSPLEPVGVALAAYRDRVAGAFDFRVASFRIGVSFTRGARTCTVWAAGQHPPDGRAWSSCMDFHDRTACAGAADEGVTRIALQGADLKYARDCFRR
ncbi:MAG: hypothetical protein JRI25_11435 [Deltaproteobacteria bacterium]|nr:hypothetical protein [Deltaproteobacteria bacterium]